MKKYKIVWEVSKVGYINAESEDEALDKFFNGKPEDIEDEDDNEITMQPEAYEIK